MLGAKAAGVDEIFSRDGMQQFLGEVFREVDIFKNDIPLFLQRFVSPLSSMGPNFYKYYLLDTLDVNGQKCGTHKGGYVSFSVDITRYLFAGKNVITIHVEDDTRSRLIPSGKQSTHYESYSCYYTRTTGIWQTVWLEPVASSHITSIKAIPNIDMA